LTVISGNTKNPYPKKNFSYQELKFSKKKYLVKKEGFRKPQLVYSKNLNSSHGGTNV